jgi:hypothetical protein
MATLQRTTKRKVTKLEVAQARVEKLRCAEISRAARAALLALSNPPRYEQAALTGLDQEVLSMLVDGKVDGHADDGVDTIAGISLILNDLNWKDLIGSLWRILNVYDDGKTKFFVDQDWIKLNGPKRRKVA